MAGGSFFGAGAGEFAALAGTLEPATAAAVTEEEPTLLVLLPASLETGGGVLARDFRAALEELGAAADSSSGPSSRLPPLRGSSRLVLLRLCAASDFARARISAIFAAALAFPMDRLSTLVLIVELGCCVLPALSPPLVPKRWKAASAMRARGDGCLLPPALAAD